MKILFEKRTKNKHGGGVMNLGWLRLSLTTESKQRVRLTIGVETMVFDPINYQYRIVFRLICFCHFTSNMPYIFWIVNQLAVKYYKRRKLFEKSANDPLDSLWPGEFSGYKIDLKKCYNCCFFCTGDATCRMNQCKASTSVSYLYPSIVCQTSKLNWYRLWLQGFQRLNRVPITSHSLFIQVKRSLTF